METKNNQHIEAIEDIRTMMKKSTRFLSLSGLSGIFVGIIALIGAYLAHWYLIEAFLQKVAYVIIRLNLIILALGVLACSFVTAYYFSYRKAKKSGQNLWDHSALRVFVNLAIPLIAGGVFCLALLYHGSIVYIAPTMLLFYGLALVNASKYTYEDIRYFGLCEMSLGLISAFNIGNGLLYWAIGFGVLHIVYGLVVWFKYEKRDGRD